MQRQGQPQISPLPCEMTDKGQAPAGTPANGILDTGALFERDAHGESSGTRAASLVAEAVGFVGGYGVCAARDCRRGSCGVGSPADGADDAEEGG